MTQSSVVGYEAGRPAVGPGRRALDRVAIVLGLAAWLALIGTAGWAALKLVPDQLSLTLAGKTLTVHNVHDRVVSNALLLFMLLPLAFGIETATVGWRKSSLRAVLFDRTASIKTDLVVLLAGQAHVLDLVGKVLVLGASMISGLWVRNWLTATFGVTITPPAMPLPLAVVFWFFVYTFFDYWTHRIDHMRLFWPLHRYHHSAEDFSVLTSARQHPAAFTPIFIINLPMAVLGASPEAMIFVNVITIGLGFLIHSRIDSNWGWIGRWIVQSPNHHRLHHKLDMSKPTGHFAMAPIWDHLFGTWYGEADQSLAIGVSRPYRHGFNVIPDMARDYADLWLGFLGRRPEL
ncbi:MAG TPA: sterol desaturase family protein [Caulobacteraceae bacterium]|nr:sterol desaturase family protein [Caulobacteraceae bacterium]